ncbi:hypothetical protein PVAND_009048 [Polypedilum vanderplanki]|uniref:Uncharacterized protein n=1 Tax=Polypedilum vanderplanki TaxID=319348 RepID=A0A9J6CCK5_POLVA|nr:hypothetical protein PVAND_009048 [Polypedilum vanderplanki]
MESSFIEEPLEIKENEALDFSEEQLIQSLETIVSNPSSDTEDSDTSSESEQDDNDSDPDYFPTDREMIDYVRDLVEDGNETAIRIMGKAFKKGQKDDQKSIKADGDGPISSRTRSKTTE